MAYSPIALTVPQYHVNGSPASGYVLKAYQAGTSTLLQMAVDSSGNTLVNDVVLNSAGFPEVSGNVIIPHVNANFKLALYPSEAAADANSGATWTIDNLTPTGISASTVQTVATLTALRNFTGSATTVILEGAAASGDGSGDVYYYASGASIGTYVDNGASIIVPTGGDGSAAWLTIGVGDDTGGFSAYTAGGTADAQTVTLSPAITEYSASVRIAFIPVANNTGACTLNANGQGAVSIKMLDGTDPPAGALDSSGAALVQHNGTHFVLLNPAVIEAGAIDGLTATAAELNTLDGITASTAELNIMDGVTATAAELNILDGVTSTTAELNILDGVTATTAELNKTDDSAAAISGYVSGMRTYIHEDGATSFASTFSVSANITEDTFESVGPTGSGATNIWTQMDNIPENARIAILGVDINATGSLDSEASAFVYARMNGSSADTNNATAIAKAQSPIDDKTGSIGTLVTAFVPLSSSRIVDLAWDQTNTSSRSISIYLKGFIV